MIKEIIEKYGLFIVLVVFLGSIAYLNVFQWVSVFWTMITVGFLASLLLLDTDYKIILSRFIWWLWAIMTVIGIVWYWISSVSAWYSYNEKGSDAGNIVLNQIWENIKTNLTSNNNLSDNLKETLITRINNSKELKKYASIKDYLNIHIKNDIFFKENVYKYKNGSLHIIRLTNIDEKTKFFLKYNKTFLSLFNYVVDKNFNYKNTIKNWNFVSNQNVEFTKNDLNNITCDKITEWWNLDNNKCTIKNIKNANYALAYFTPNN